jgi:ferredoxin-NADP reductase
LPQNPDRIAFHYEARQRDEVANKDRIISAQKEQIAVQLERIGELSNTVEAQARQIQTRDALLSEVGSLLGAVQKEIETLTRQRTEKDDG